MAGRGGRSPHPPNVAELIICITSVFNPIVGKLVWCIRAAVFHTNFPNGLSKAPLVGDTR
jgi:hypothetical protein